MQCSVVNVKLLGLSRDMRTLTIVKPVHLSLRVIDVWKVNVLVPGYEEKYVNHDSSTYPEVLI
jgi:hypothetical protein